MEKRNYREISLIVKNKKGFIKIGDTFNLLTVQKIYDKPMRNTTVKACDCICACGNLKQGILARNLITGNVKSCGCLLKKELDKNSYNYKRRCVSQNMSQSRIYMIWQDMKRRCYNPNRKNYKHYGGKGIIVCNEWLNFNNFYNWAKEHGYNEKMTIERKDNNKNYCPDNCTWIPRNKQSENLTKNHYLTINNETHPLNTWAKMLNIPNSTIRERLKRGWTVEEALNFKTRERN